MQATPSSAHSDAESAPPAHPHSRGRSRLIGLFILLLILVSIAVLPPLVNVSRFQKRIARNISSALGRPVYFDNVTLVLFPQPGFTLDNFILDEDPAFGYEPILRADQVQVTLRLSSLFRRHTEFSKIAFSSPSVNLVYTKGRWNIESLLLQAAHTQAAPTAQRFPGPARRFPYIEATGARLNLKLDQEKSPVSFTDADFALWLPSPHQWHLRLEAHPTRTDSAPGDTGTLRAEGTLGGGDLDSLAPVALAEVPIDLQGDWRDAQLGGLSRLLLGRDPGLRGDLALAFALRGTIGRNAITANIKLDRARRADFVPDHLLSLEASCDATATNTFRAFPTIACHWPPAGSSDPALISLAASLPDARTLDSASATLTLPALPADTFFDWLAIATPHPPAALPGTGIFTGSLTWGTARDVEIGQDFRPGTNSTASTRASVPGTRPSTTRHKGPLFQQSLQPTATLTGQIEFTGGSLILDPAANRTLSLGDVVLTSTPPPVPASPHSRSHHLAAPPNCHPAASNLRPATCNLQLPAASFTLQPLSLDLGGRQPATLTAHFDTTGYTLHLTGSALPSTLRQLANAVPQLGDNLIPLLDQLSPGQPTHPDAAPTPAPPPARGLQPAVSQKGQSTGALAPGVSLTLDPAAPIAIDLTATRPWGSAQIWTDTSAHH